MIQISIDNEEELRAKAKLANMRYVDYLHKITNSKRVKDYNLAINKD